MSNAGPDCCAARNPEWKTAMEDAKRLIQVGIAECVKEESEVGQTTTTEVWSRVAIQGEVSVEEKRQVA